MSQIECKLARTWSNWGFLRWCHIGCCACANLKLTENFRESGACCKRLRNVAWQKNSLWSGLTASGSCIRLAQDLCCMFDTQTVFVRPSHPHGCVNWSFYVCLTYLNTNRCFIKGGRYIEIRVFVAEEWKMDFCVFCWMQYFDGGSWFLADRGEMTGSIIGRIWKDIVWFPGYVCACSWGYFHVFRKLRSIRRKKMPQPLFWMRIRI